MTRPPQNSTRACSIIIDRLVIDGLPLAPAEGARLRVAAEQELARLFTKGGIKDCEFEQGAVPRLDGGEIRAARGSDPADLGRQVARNVYAGIANRGAAA